MKLPMCRRAEKKKKTSKQKHLIIAFVHISALQVKCSILGDVGCALERECTLSGGTVVGGGVREPTNSSSPVQCGHRMVIILIEFEVKKLYTVKVVLSGHSYGHIAVEVLAIILIL